METAWGLFGVALGWGLSSVTEMIRRRWSRQEKMHDLHVQRGEELLQCCQQTFQWVEDASRAAFQGDIYVPIQHPIFRLVAIVEIYFPSLIADARDLDTAARAYRDRLVEIASNKGRGLPMTTELNEEFQATHISLPPVIGKMLTKARQAVRAAIQTQRE